MKKPLFRFLGHMLIIGLLFSFSPLHAAIVFQQNVQNQALFQPNRNYVFKGNAYILSPNDARDVQIVIRGNADASQTVSLTATPQKYSAYVAEAMISPFSTNHTPPVPTLTQIHFHETASAGNDSSPRIGLSVYHALPNSLDVIIVPLSRTTSTQLDVFAMKPSFTDAIVYTAPNSQTPAQTFYVDAWLIRVDKSLTLVARVTPYGSADKVGIMIMPLSDPSAMDGGPHTTDVTSPIS